MDYLFMFLEIIFYIVCITGFSWLFLEDFKTQVGFIGSGVGRLVFDILAIISAIMLLKDTIVDIMMV